MIRVLLGMLVALGVWAGAAHAGTYRVLTYNVQGLPQIPTGVEYDYGRGNEARGRDIGARARNAGYDVMAFNEVFADSMRNGLLSQFPKAAFPTQITKLAGGTAFVQDSGLVLVSRFPSMPMPNVAPAECKATTPAGCLVAFHEYDACSTAGDCNAEKGIGLVRLQNPHTGRPLDVLFSHMQADYGNTATKQARAKQFEEVHAFLDRWVPANGAAERDAIFIGDLNVIGGSSEWASKIGPGSGLAARGFRDLWRDEQGPGDFGFTIDPRGARSRLTPTERLDYVLFRAAAGTSCVHQIRMPWKLMRDGTRHDLSDHWPIEATIGGTPGPRCSLRTAQAITADGVVTATPADPGGSVWFRVDTPGTWNLHHMTPGTTTQAYHAPEFSNALGTTGSTRSWFVVRPGRPVYVRMLPANRAAQPPITTGFYRAQGLSTGDPIHLTTFVKETASFATNIGNLADPQNKLERYFHIQALQTHGGKQEIRLSAAGGGNVDRLQIRLLDMKGKQLAHSGAYRAKPVLKAKVKKAGGHYLVAVRRQALSQIGPVQVLFQSNLRSVRLLRLRCNTQEDNTGDDDIRLRYGVDRPLSKSRNLGSFDGDQARSLETRIGSSGMVNFTDRINLQVIELDDDPNDNLGSGSIKRGPVVGTPKVGRMRFTGHGADYELFYERLPLP